MTIVFVADQERAKNARPTGVYVDAGTMGQSCYLAAAALGLAGAYAPPSTMRSSGRP